MFSKIIKVIKNPKMIIRKLNNEGYYVWRNDIEYLKWNFKNELDYELNLSKPKTYNEKLQWLKLYDKNKKYTQLVDKYEVRKYIKNTIGEEYLNTLLGTWNNFDAINFDELPNKFVLKCTHDSGGLIICKDKNKLDLKAAKKKITKSLKKNYYYAGREWPYKNVQPRIIAEKYMEDSVTKDLKDYKIFCFNGEAKFIEVVTNANHKYFQLNHYDLDWNEVTIKRKKHPRNINGHNKPKKFKKMLELAHTLAKDIPFCRVDLYDVNNEIIFGEITFFPASGFYPFENIEDDLRLGKLLKLPKNK